MKTYRTAEVARIVGVHPNTVRVYEAWELIPKARRRENGYRAFSQFHVDQLILVRLLLKVEVLHKGLRKRAIGIIRASAAKDFDQAIQLTEGYLTQIRQEQRIAQDAIAIAEALGSTRDESKPLLRRTDVARHLGITIETLRNWERNGLLTADLRHNGVRLYTPADIRRLTIIRALRSANYSITAILRMVKALYQDPDADIRQIMNTPGDEEIISVCDRLLGSLKDAEVNACKVHELLREFQQNPPI